MLEEVLDRSGLRAALVAEGTFEAQGRVENLDEMVRVGAEYEASDEEPTLAGFLEGVALQADADLVDQSAGAVTLMTIHNAKGLEFDTVLITGLEEGSSRTRAPTRPRPWRRSAASSTWASRERAGRWC